MRYKGPFGPKRLFLRIFWAGIDLGKRVRKMVLEAMNKLEQGRPARKQRLSLRLVGKMHRTAECVRVRMCDAPEESCRGKRKSSLEEEMRPLEASTPVAWKRVTSQRAACGRPEIMGPCVRPPPPPHPYHLVMWKKEHLLPIC